MFKSSLFAALDSTTAYSKFSAPSGASKLMPSSAKSSLENVFTVSFLPKNQSLLFFLQDYSICHARRLWVERG